MQRGKQWQEGRWLADGGGCCGAGVGRPVMQEQELGGSMRGGGRRDKQPDPCHLHPYVLPHATCSLLSSPPMSALSGICPSPICLLSLPLAPACHLLSSFSKASPHSSPVAPVRAWPGNSSGSSSGLDSGLTAATSTAIAVSGLGRGRSGARAMLDL